MMTEPLSYSAAFAIGLLGGVHCIGMCGGIVNALSFAVHDDRRDARHIGPILLSYNLGRIFSYSVAGALVGVAGGWLHGTGGLAGPALRIVAGLMLIAMGLYLAGWWRGLSRLEQLGGHLWRRVQPLGHRFMPVTRPSQAVVIGSLWGWLPCGLVYSTLTWSATAASALQSALLMLCFGLGTLPAMLLTGALAHRLKSWTQRGAVRNAAALLVIAFGVWTIGAALCHGGHAHTEPAGTESHVHDRAH
jgi:sulfite exporter TauE/SafE